MRNHHRQHRQSKSILLTLLLLLISITPAVSVVPGHSIVLDSYEYTNGNTVLTYTVTSGSGPAISHWTLGTCEGITDNGIISASEPFEFKDANNPDPTTGAVGVKFDTGYNDAEQRQVTITLDGLYAIGSVTAYIKAGQTTPNLAIQGPICEKPDLQPVKPILECVIDNGDGTYTVHFGYLNQNDNAVDIPVGANNTFNQSSYNTALPTTFEPGRTGYWPNSGFSVVVDAGDLQNNLVWTLEGPDGSRRAATASTNTTPCSYHIFFEKSWEGDMPETIPEDYEIVAESEFGTAVCTYEDNGNGLELVCEYDNDMPPALDNKGLWVPVGGEYTVTENNLPQGWEAKSGTGTFTVSDGYAQSGYDDLDKYYMHTVVNKEAEQSVLPITPFILCVMDLGNGLIQVQFGFYNPNGNTVIVEVGPNNQVSPSQYNGAQPTVFPPSNPQHPQVTSVATQSASQQKSQSVATIAAAGSFADLQNGSMPIDPENSDGPVFEMVFEDDQQVTWSLNADNTTPRVTKEASRDNIICVTNEGCLRGIVTLNGKPLADVVVRLSYPGLKTIKQYTDAQGEFAFENLIPEHRYTLTVEGYDDEEINIRTADPQLGCEFVEVNLGSCQPVLAWYEAWYGDPGDSLRYWDQEKFGGISDTARFDLYDSYDPDIWEYHILAAWASDIDAFVVNWYGEDSYEQSPTKGLLDAAQSLYERFGHKGFDFRIIVSYNEEASGLLQDNFRFIADSILTHPAYWGVREGTRRPLYAFSPTLALSPADFASAAAMMLPEDVKLFWNFDQQEARYVNNIDGLYPYVASDDIPFLADGSEWGQAYLNDFYGMSDSYELTGGVWPGLDERKWSLGGGLYMSRQDTVVYDSTWNKAFTYQPDWVMVESWNGLNQTTHVEPSDEHDYRFMKMTRNNAYLWKGNCARRINDLGLTVPEHVFEARKVPMYDNTVEEALHAFFDRDYDRALSILNSGAHERSEYADNNLVPVMGSETYKKGDIEYSWDNAVDGDLSGYDGTTIARGSGYSGDPAWAIFKFADDMMYKFNYLLVATDNGTEDDAAVYPIQTQSFRVSISTTGTQAEDFDVIGTFSMRHANEQWFNLGDFIEASFIKLELLSPDYYPGGWRQIVEFQPQTHEKTGAIPVAQQNQVQEVPKETRLAQNYPNPFNPETVIRYHLGKASHVSLVVYDITGRQVAQLADEVQPAGSHQASWDAMRLPSGIYFYRLTAGSFTALKRMTLLK